MAKSQKFQTPKVQTPKKTQNPNDQEKHRRSAMNGLRFFIFGWDCL